METDLFFIIAIISDIYYGPVCIWLLVLIIFWNQIPLSRTYMNIFCTKCLLHFLLHDAASWGSALYTNLLGNKYLRFVSQYIIIFVWSFMLMSFNFFTVSAGVQQPWPWWTDGCGPRLGGTGAGVPWLSHASLWGTHPQGLYKCEAMSLCTECCTS